MLDLRRGRFIRDILRVQKGAGRQSADGEVYILRNITRRLCHLNGIQLANNYANDVAGEIQQWATTITRLYRRGDLNQAAVIAGPCKRTNGSCRDV